MCLLRGTDWIFKKSSLRYVFKVLYHLRQHFLKFHSVTADSFHEVIKKENRKAGKVHAPGVHIPLIIDSTCNEGPNRRMIAATYDTAEKHFTNEYGLFNHA